MTAVPRLDAVRRGTARPAVRDAHAHHYSAGAQQPRQVPAGHAAPQGMQAAKSFERHRAEGDEHDGSPYYRGHRQHDQV